jgi:ABC-2 type transport system permease protein
VRTALLIALKDLRLRLRDRSALIWGIVAPLALATIFSFVFNPISQDEFHADFVLVDADGGPLAQSFREFLAGLEDDGLVTVREVESEEEARRQVETGSESLTGTDADAADAALVVPAGFSQGVLAGEGGELLVFGSRSSQLSSQLAYSLAGSFASELHAVNVALHTALPPGEANPARSAALAGEAQAVPNPITVEDISASTRQLDSTTQMAAGMGIFFVFFTVQFGVSGLLEERRLGTMSRLLAAPINATSIILGKALSSFVLGLVSLGVLIVATTLLLGADWGNPLGVVILVAAGVFAAMGILAVVASVAKTQDQASSLGAIISLVLGFLGGTFFPVAQVGGILAFLSLLTPHAWFIRGLGDLAGGETSAILPSVAALFAFGLLTGALSWFFLRRAVLR